jgi:hypothetical protein
MKMPSDPTARESRRRANSDFQPDESCVEPARHPRLRGFSPKLKRAAERLKDLRTPEDQPIPPNTLAELRRDMERRGLVSDQIRQIEHARLDCIEHAPSDGPHAMVRLLARVIGIGTEMADMLVQEVLSRNMRRPTGCSALCWPHWLT